MVYMTFAMNLTAQNQMIAARGPRYCLAYAAGQGSYHAVYMDTAEAAEQRRERLLDEGGYRNIQVHLPDIAGFDVDLDRFGAERKAAVDAAEERTRVLRAAVIRAAEVGRAEAEIARSAGVDRMTVRKWLGK